MTTGWKRGAGVAASLDLLPLAGTIYLLKFVGVQHVEPLRCF